MLCCVIGFVILMTVAIYNLVQTRNDQKVKAEISSVKTELYERSGDSQTGKAHFVTYPINTLYWSRVVSMLSWPISDWRVL